MATIRAVKSGLTPALSKLLPSETTQQLTQLSNQSRNLYETLSRLPNDGVGTRVFQTRWQSKGIQGCCWDVTRVRTKLGGTRGKAWGKLVWRGKPVNEKEEQIPGGLKYKWSPGVSKGENLKAVQPIPPLKRVTQSHQTLQPTKRVDSELERVVRDQSLASSAAKQKAPQVDVSGGDREQRSNI